MDAPDKVDELRHALKCAEISLDGKRDRRWQIRNDGYVYRLAPDYQPPVKRWWFDTVTNTIIKDGQTVDQNMIEVTEDFARYVQNKPDGEWDLRKPGCDDTIFDKDGRTIKAIKSIYDYACPNKDDLGYRWCKPHKPEELTIEEMNYSKERGMHIAMSHPLFAKLTHEMCKLFEGSGAVNYLEFEARSDEYGPMLVCIQRAEGKTPAQENVRLKAENKALADALRVRLLGICKDCGYLLDIEKHIETCRHYETEKKLIQQS